MRKIAFALAMMVGAASVYAACPPDRPYNCVTTMSGKQRCGCGV